MKHISTEIKWAIIFTIVGLAWMLLEKLCGLHGKYIDYHPYLTNIFAIPAIWMMVSALKEKKRTFYAGNMTYLQGFLSGLVLTVFIALLSPLAQWVTSYVITPEFFPNAIKRSVELGYYATPHEAETYFNFKSYVTMGLFGALGMGILTTAIAMIFIRSKPSKT